MACYTYHESTNSSGKHLLQFTEENDVIVTNTTIQKKRGKLWSYISDMNGSQIDFILVNRKWRSSVKNVERFYYPHVFVNYVNKMYTMYTK